MLGPLHEEAKVRRVAQVKQHYNNRRFGFCAWLLQAVELELHRCQQQKGVVACCVAAEMWRSSPGMSSMLGPFHEEAKVRRVAQVRMKSLKTQVVLLLRTHVCFCWARAAGSCSSTLCWLGSEAALGGETDRV
jgi:hypothetical protein